MAKPLALIGVLVLSAAYGTVGPQNGCRDVVSSWTHLSYYPKRDMRSTVVVMPQKVVVRSPDSLSVPVGGKEPLLIKDGSIDYEGMGAMMVNPVPATEASVVRGDSLFHRLCMPCHGPKMAGDGPVAPMFMPPPDLLAETTRNRRDGYIYSYIRHGGVVMPSYGPAVTPLDAWNVINYLRMMQKTSPR